MSLVSDIESALGMDTGGMSLVQMQTMARAVNVAPVKDLADAFDTGQQTLTQHGNGLSDAAGSIPGGWQGQAADAATTKVLDTSTQGHESAAAASNSADALKSFASTVQTQKSAILAIEPVDTSFSAAVSKAGGPVMAAFDPGAVAVAWSQAQAESASRTNQAAGHLQTIDNAAQQVSQQTTFPSLPAPGGRFDSSGLPGTLTVPAVSGGSTGPAARIYQPPGASSSGPGSSSTAGPGPRTSGTGPSLGSGPTGSVPPPSGSNPGGGIVVTPGPSLPGGPSTGSNVGSVPVAGSGPGVSVPGLPAGGGPATTPSSVGSGPSTVGSIAPPQSLGDPSSSGISSGVGISAGAAAGGGALLLAGTAGMGSRGLAPGSPGGLGGVDGGRLGGNPGVEGAAGPEGGLRTGLGAGSNSESLRAGSGEPGLGAESGAGARGLTEEPGLRPGSLAGGRPGGLGGEQELSASRYNRVSGSSGYGSESGYGPDSARGYGANAGYGENAGYGGGAGYGEPGYGSSGVRGSGAEPSGGYGAAGEPGELAARGGFGAPGGGELSAGESRGLMPGGAGGARRGDDEQELNKRPDYLVETDDIWGDGRLAAPPVLG